MDRRKGSLILTGILLAAPASLRAQQDETSSASHIQEPAQAATDGGARPIRIAAGRAADLVGAPRYADRSAVGTGAMLVTFSDRPVIRPHRAPGGQAVSAPIRGARLTSAFGYRRHPITGGWRMHNGVDLAAPWGTPVVAAQSGKVRFASWRGGYGLLVVLDHEGGGETRYAHLSRIAVQAGQRVADGQTVGFVGATGNATGPHLHFETRAGGRAYKPATP